MRHESRAQQQQTAVYPVHLISPVLSLLWAFMQPLILPFLPKLKIVWSFYQITALAPRIYMLNLPASVRALLDWFSLAVECRTSCS